MCEVRRILQPGGTFLGSAYGNEHMKEISKLVQEFDRRIVLAAENLYENFGLENGQAILEPYFSQISCLHFDEDHIQLDQPEPLIQYILSCHGNQNQMLLDRYKDFRQFVEKKTAKRVSYHERRGNFSMFNVKIS